jgi:hypothetical protein
MIEISKRAQIGAAKVTYKSVVDAKKLNRLLISKS